MRRALVALTLMLTLTLNPACTPAAGAQPTPTTTTTVAAHVWTKTELANLYWWHFMLRRQADAKRRADERFTAILRLAAAIDAEKRAYPHGLCGGDLPPCYVMMRESRGIITARNPTSSASGKWQFIRGTWARFGGYSDAYLAPERVQDAKARQLWAGGRGCSHWSAC